MLETAFLPKRVLTFALALFLAAGAAQPALATAKTSPANPKHPAAFETGKTTLKEVEQALGEPNASAVSAGQKTACYQYAGMATVPESFIPMVGAPSAQAALTCCFRFTSDGVLADSTSTTLDRIKGALKGPAAADAKTGRKITCPPPLFRSGRTAVVVYGAAAPVSETAQQPPGDNRSAKARADTRSGGNQTRGDGSVSDRGKQTTGDGVHRP